jgi:hypothetical protein
MQNIKYDVQEFAMAADEESYGRNVHLWKLIRRSKVVLRF